MGAAWFYHLTRRPVEAALPVLLERALAADWRVAVRGTDHARLARLDEALWTYDPDAFLPHGMAGGRHDARQPVLLTDRAEAPNGAVCVMAVDGAGVTADEVKALQRVCILFDGQDPAAVDHARGQWAALVGAGCAATYWSEETGRWEKKVDRPARD